MKPSLVVVLLATVLSVVALPACPGSQLCVKALPVISAAQTYSTDAALALDQAQQVLDSLPLPADKKAEIQAGIDKARDALRATDALLSACNDACTAPDLNVIFKDFLAAWSALKGLFGTNAAQGMFGAAPGVGIRIVDPLIYRKAGGT